MLGLREASLPSVSPRSSWFPMLSDLSLTLLESPEVEDGVLHLDGADLRSLGLVAGDVIVVEGARRTCLAAQNAFVGDRNQRIARVSPLSARNLGSLSGEKVRLLPERIKAPVAELVTIQAEDDVDQIHILARLKQIGSFWNKRTVSIGDSLIVPTLDRFPLLVTVAGIQPQGPVQIGHATEFAVATRKTEPASIRIGGLREIYRTCQVLVKDRFGVSGGAAPRSVLLTGPAGMGKSRMVARLAQETECAFKVLDAYQLLDRAVVQPDLLDLGSLLPELARHGKAILLLDHLEILALLAADSSLGRSVYAVVAQLCSLLDDLTAHPQIMAFGVGAKEIEPRFLHSGRFDVSLPVDLSNRWGRAEVFLMATETLALEETVDPAQFAARTGGMTSGDIVRVVKTASLLARGGKISDFDLSQALRSVEPSAAGDVLCDVPTTMWDEVAGLDDIKELMYETLVWSLYQYDKFLASGVRPPRSILLSGGQGTGKTSLVRALAGFIPMHFIEVSCPLLIGRHREDSARYLKECFSLARRKTPCLIFLDDLDALFETFSSGSGATHQHPIVAQLLAELDMLATHAGIVVVAATNRPDRLTPDILSAGRFDFAVTLPMPDSLARKRILQIHARKLLLSTDIDFERLAMVTQGMSSAEIANLCNRVGLMSLRQAFATTETSAGLPVVTADLFDQALRGRK